MRTNKTNAPLGEILGLMNPFTNKSFNGSFNSRNFAGGILHRGIEIGSVSGSISVSNSTSHSEGKMGKSYGSTSGNSFTIGVDYRVGGSSSKFLTLTKGDMYPLEITFFAFR